MSESYYNGNYTGAEIDAGIAAANAAAPQATTYTKSEVDTALSAKANSADLGTAAFKNMDSALNASSTNPVQNSTLSAKFSEVDTTLDLFRLMLDATVYGFRIDKTNSDPETRVEYLYDAAGMTPARMDYTTGTFDYGSWGNAWFITGNKPCALKYDGTIDYYLDPNDYTKKTDGTASDVSDSSYAGNFMASMPTVWIKRWEDERYLYYAFSDKQINSSFKAYAHDAGDGFINDMIYLPMFKGVIVDSKLRSIAGVTPQGGTNGSTEKTAAETCGTGWQMWDWAKHELIADLLTLISRSTNSQANFGEGDVNTYDSSDTTTYGKLPTGTSGAGQFWGANDETHHVKVFHIEDFWGNRTDRCLGLHLVDNEYVYKLVRPYATTPDSTYTSSGKQAPVQGMIKNASIGEFGFLPTETGWNGATYFCDALVPNASGTRLLRFGSACNVSPTTTAGDRNYILNAAANETQWYIGASLCFNAPHSS